MCVQFRSVEIVALVKTKDSNMCGICTKREIGKGECHHFWHTKTANMLMLIVIFRKLNVYNYRDVLNDFLCH